ncbi:MAG: YdcF family protein [Mariprofundaceae bacterium]|nr:YdcF family protein [Mariprofundaceae bacterium]
MFIIFKAIALLLLPPAGPLLLALGGLLFYQNWWGKVIVWCSLLTLLALATTPVRDLLIKPLEYTSPALSLSALPTEQAAVVLLGGGLYEKAPEYDGQNLPSNHALMRTLYAAEIARRSGFTVYASGGAPLNKEAEPEALVLQRWLIKFGVDPMHIHTENSSRNTAENAKNIAKILHKKGIQHVLLVTTAAHMPRSVIAFSAEGLAVIAAPTKYKTKQTPYQALDFLPDANTLSDSSFALHEYLGILWYRIHNFW